ncbi:6264_t:CDS:2 [Gigaspora rosea]|nr:6264_t:CDS:2 [Gigaspora rosea]
MVSNRSKAGIKDNSVHNKRWNLEHEEVSGSMNEKIKENVEIKLMGGGPLVLLKVITGVNKKTCETGVSQAQTINQNKKEHYSKIETGMHTRKNIFARLQRKDRETLSIDSAKVTEEDWNAYRGRLEKEKRVLELQELQVENENLRILKKDIRRIAKWCSKIKKFKFQETENSELDLFILEEGAKGLLKDLRNKHNKAHIEGETLLYQDLKSIKKDL